MFGRCKHQWEVKGWHQTSIYGDGFGNMTKIPSSYTTEATFVCSGCGKVKTTKYKGLFADPRKGS